MFVDTPSNPNGLLLICDARFRYDRELQETQGGQPVMREWAFGKAVLGKKEWARTTRLALYDYSEDVDATPAGLTVKQGRVHRAHAKAAKRAELLEFLGNHNFRCIVVLQTRSAELKSKEEFGDAKGMKGTMCWTVFAAPDSLSEMAGCIWNSPLGDVMPLLNPINYEYVYGEYIRRQLLGAWAFAMGKEQVLQPNPIKTAANDVTHRLAILSQLLMRSTKNIPLAVDIESYSPDHLITAIGISDGDISVSVPWDEFTPFGSEGIEPGRSAEEEILVKTILASNCPKVFHNYTYDVPFLESKECKVDGRIHDTYAMHGIIYKQWRHGLQRACAGELLIPPWKSVWHPKNPPVGMSKDDPDWWVLEPTSLRDYNAKDSFYTWHLYKALCWKLGITL